MNVLRRGVAAAAVVGMLQLVAAGPAAATGTATCVPLPGSTPAAGADLDGDGTEDVRLPAISDVELCAGANVVLAEPVTIEREQCGGFGSCMRYYVTYEVSGYAQKDVTFCYSADGTRVCTATDPAPIPVDLVSPQTMCFGWDLRGGYPCPSGGPVELG